MMVPMDAPRPITPPGWYDDGHGRLRWYDGSQWTQHTAALTHTAPPRQPVAPARPRQEELVAVKRSTLVWILPIVVVLAALLGGLSAVAMWNAGAFSAEPLERTYADFVRAEQTRDCAALEEVTTRSFRDDLWDEPFTCATLNSRPPVMRGGEPEWGMRLGPVGFLLVEDSGTIGLDDSSDDLSTIQLYTLIREDGRWKLDSQD